MIDLLACHPNMAQIARIMLCQSGPLTEFGKLEQGDQIVIESCHLDVEKIVIVASYGTEVRTFTLKLQRVPEKSKGMSKEEHREFVENWEAERIAFIKQGVNARRMREL